MITFAPLLDPNARTQVIPTSVGDKKRYVMYLGDIQIGTTRGKHNNRLIISLHGQGHHQFCVKDIEANMNNDIGIEELYALGTPID